MLFKNKKNIRCSNIEIQKQKFNQYKESISIKNIDINKRVLSNKVSFGKERFIHFKDAKKSDL